MSRRAQIAMSEKEVRDFLLASKTIIICSIGPGGYPHPMPMWFALDEDGSVRMTTFRKSQKVKNVQRDPRVSLLVEDGEQYQELRGVVLYGRCEVLDDLEAVKETLVDIGKRQAPGDAEAQKNLAAGVAVTAPKRVCLRVRPGRTVSWDHRKLGGVY